MRQAGTKLIVFLRCYQSLIAWGICAVVVLMTFFQRYLSGELCLLALFIGMFANLFLICKGRKRHPMPGRFKAFVIFILILSGLFALINFLIYFLTYPGGEPRIINGSYVLDYKGTIARYITQQEYHRLKCIEQRFFAGHLLFFYAGTMFLHVSGSKLKLKVWMPGEIKKGDL